MANIKELREEQARIWTNARSKLDEVKDDTPEDRAADINREFDAMMAEHDKIGDKVDRFERLKRAEQIAAEEREAIDERKRPVGSDAEARNDAGQVSYRDAFHSYLKAAGNLGDMDREARAVLQRGFSDVEARAQTTTASAGGYMVPQELANILVKSLAAWGPMYDPGVTSEIVTSGGYTITMPTVDDTATVVVQHSEGTTLTDDGGADVTFGEKTLSAFAYNTEWLRVSKELVEDASFNVEQILGELLGERLARRVNTELTTGDNTGDPHGVATAATSGVTAGSATVVVADELIDLLHSVDPAYRGSPRARWMMNDLSFAKVRKLKYGDGTYIVQPDFGQGYTESLLGYPITINQAMPAMTTGNKSVLFGDFGKYYVRKVGAPLIGAIQDKDFWPGFGIAGYIRLDGELADTAAIKAITMA